MNRDRVKVDKMHRVTILEVNRVIKSCKCNSDIMPVFIYSTNNLSMVKNMNTSNFIKAEYFNCDTSCLSMVKNVTSSNSNVMEYNNCIIRISIELEEPRRLALAHRSDITLPRHRVTTLPLHHCITLKWYSGRALKRGEGVGLNQNGLITLNKSPPLTLRLEKVVKLEIIKN